MATKKLDKKKKRKILKRVVKSKTKDPKEIAKLRTELLSAIAPFDWEIMRKAIKKELDTLFSRERRDLYFGNSRAYEQDREAMYRLLEKLDRIVNLDRPQINYPRFEP